MHITLLYFEDCPNWKVADERLTAIAAERGDITVTRHRVETAAKAGRTRFHGSPTILVDGVDAFAEPGTAVGPLVPKVPDTARVRRRAHP